MHNSFRMINIGAKPVTYRLAVAYGEIKVGSQAFPLIRDRKLPKGDALMLSEIAGITGAKKAHELIPLCHPMGLDHVRVVAELDERNSSINLTCFASTHAKTGVEMEALAGVNAALLTIWDLTKMIEPDLQIGNVRLLAKLGGKSGFWLNPAGVPAWVMEEIRPAVNPLLSGLSAAVLTLSDRAHKGDYDDKSGAILKGILTEHGASILDYRVLPDDAETIKTQVMEIVKSHAPDLLLCTGGTGVAKRDVTPDALNGLFDSEIPGIGELLRSDGAKFTPYSWSSRSTGGMIGSTLIVALPGNPDAVKEGMGALLPHLLPHLVRTIRGEKS